MAASIFPSTRQMQQDVTTFTAFGNGQREATDRFLDKLAGVDDPETKRMIIGGEFIEVFAEEARKLDGIEFLAALFI